MTGPNQEDGDVSKRPKPANAVMSRLRRPAGRLRDLPIWSKLGLIMLVPTLATIIVGVSGLVEQIDEASNADRARTLSVLSQNAGALVDSLQAVGPVIIGGDCVAVAFQGQRNGSDDVLVVVDQGDFSHCILYPPDRREPSL